MSACSECGRQVPDGERRAVADDGQTYCWECYGGVADYIDSLSGGPPVEVRFGGPVVGALLGAAAGIAVWWVFATRLDVTFRLIGALVGFTVGYGVLFVGGQQRAKSLQTLAAGGSVLAYVVGAVFVDRALGVPVIQFGFIDLLLIAIAAYESWRIPKPEDL